MENLWLKSIQGVEGHAFSPSFFIRRISRPRKAMDSPVRLSSSREDTLSV